MMCFKCLPCGPQRFTYQQERSFCYASSTSDQWRGMWQHHKESPFVCQMQDASVCEFLYLAAWPTLLSGLKIHGLVYESNGYIYCAFMWRKVGDLHSF